MGRWSNVVVREFLAWLSVPPHGRWLDVGCGTGALASAILQSASPSEVCGIDPSEEYIAYARAMLPKDRCHLLVADAQALPHELSGFDAHSLRSSPQPGRGARRGCRRDDQGYSSRWACRCVCVDFAGGMQLLRYLWDVATKLDPSAEELDQGKCFPICHPDKLRVLFTEAGLRAIQVRPLEVLSRF